MSRSRGRCERKMFWQILGMSDFPRPWLKPVRKVHLYLGCLCAPLLVLFCVTGAFQAFGLRPDDTSVLTKLAAVHTEQSWGRGHISLPLKILSLLMAWSVVVASALGIVMAFRLAPDRRMVWACLVFGSLLPVTLLAIELFKN